jgi:mono/diheme cytochrome c family protein
MMQLNPHHQAFQSFNSEYNSKDFMYPCKSLLYILLFSFVLLLFTSCKEGEERLLNASNLSSFFIEVEPFQALQFQTPKGATITIQKGTFDKRVTLEIKEAYSSKDILYAGLTTESNGTPLISGGMIYINEKNRNSIIPKQPIKISIPTDYVNTDMQLYKGEEGADGIINWTNPDTIPANSTTDMILEGKALFQQNCRTCHAINQNLTGPGLGGFTERGPWKERKNIYNWIHNPAAFMAKDPYTLNLKAKYGAVMQAFPQLSNEQIDAMVVYVNNELHNPAADLDSALYNYPTVSDLCVDTLFYPDEVMVSNSNTSTDGTTSIIVSNEPNEGMRNGYTDSPSSGKYEFEIRTLGWYNVDLDIKGLPGTYPCELEVRLKGTDIFDMNVYAFFPQHKDLSVGIQDSLNFFHFKKIDGKMPMFLGSKGFILAFGSKGDQLYTGSLSFFAQPVQSFNINMKPITKDAFYDLLKAEDLEGIELRIQERQKQKDTTLQQQSTTVLRDTIKQIIYNACIQDSL